MFEKMIVSLENENEKLEKELEELRVRCEKYLEAIGNVAKVKNQEIALIAKKYAELEAENERLNIIIDNDTLTFKKQKAENLKLKNLIVSFSKCLKDDTIYMGEYVGLVEKSKKLINSCSL